MVASNDIRVGIIGPGAIGAVHARTLAELGNPAVAVAGPKPEETTKFAAEHRIGATYHSMAEMFANEAVDAVIVATPSHLHAEQALYALHSGRHVLSEIPIGMSLAEAERVAKASQGSPLVAGVAHTLRYWEPHRYVVDRFRESGRQPTHVVIRSMTLRHTNVGWTGRQRDWTDNVLWHQGAHAVDAALWFLGTDELSVRGGCGPDWPGSGRQMDVAAVLQTSDRRLAAVSLSFHSRVGVSDFLVVGEDQTYEIRDGRVYGPEGLVSDSEGTAAVQQAAIAAQDREFLAAITEGRRCHFTPADALPAMRALQALEDTRAAGLS